MAGIFWREYFGGNILAGIFWREYFCRNILAGIFWWEYFGGNIFVGKFLRGYFCRNILARKILAGVIWQVNCLNQSNRFSIADRDRFCVVQKFH